MQLGQRLYCEDTPIETYRVCGRTVYVKRDDLYSLPPAPPLGKLRGMRALLEKHAAAGNRAVGCFQTRVSNIGHALAAACLEFPHLRCVVVYPSSSGSAVPKSIQLACELGAIAKRIRSNVLPICYAQSRRILAEMDGLLLPFGMECDEAVDAVARAAQALPPDLCAGATIVVPCGSGVTMAGVLRGVPAHPNRAIGVSCGRSVKKIKACIGKYVEIASDLELIEPRISYYEMPTIKPPFPAHPYYDLKAWEYLVQHLHQLHDPILFWNVGG